jgi:Response regulator containing a CheY-like receiver domain and an HTH DNA-binding domain
MIVDDQKLFRENLKIVIELRLPDVKVVGIASNGQEALEILNNERPNLILLDMRMPGMNGLEFLKQLRKQGAEIKTIVLTTFDDDEYVFEALRLGAAGYLLKEIEPEELTAAIVDVYHGKTLMSPEITAKLVKEATRNRAIDVSVSNDAFSSLTSRELDVLRCLAMGEDNREIAMSLQIAEGTVKNHVSNIYEKLGLKDRAQAIRFAILHDLV